MTDPAGRARDLFGAAFGAAPDGVVRSPGRVNLIGDHTDYNDGFVLPVAIDREIWLAYRRRPDRRVRVVSEAFPGEPADLDLDHLEHGPPRWAEYVRGVAAALGNGDYPLAGWEGALTSTVPVGGALSSSAALEMAIARVFSLVGGRHWDAPAMARAGRWAENEWVGVSTGIMDQLIGAAGVAGHAVLIDCRSLDMRAVPIPSDVAILVIDSGTRRDLVTSAYNDRRAACETAAAELGVVALRDATPGDLDNAGLDEIVLRRARHVVSENNRTLAAAAALEAGDVARVGELMVESHHSLRDDFEVSTPALDVLVEAALGAVGCHGARLTGAGFGGCVVALVESAAADRVAATVAAGYVAATGRVAVVHRCRAVAGVGPV